MNEPLVLCIYTLRCWWWLGWERVLGGIYLTVSFSNENKLTLVLDLLLFWLIFLKFIRAETLTKLSPEVYT